MGWHLFVSLFFYPLFVWAAIDAVTQMMRSDGWRPTVDRNDIGMGMLMGAVLAVAWPISLPLFIIWRICKAWLDKVGGFGNTKAAKAMDALAELFNRSAN